jgi:hypothetical protein
VSNYGTVAGADSYFTARDNPHWNGSNAHKLAALVRASAYIDGHYRTRPKCGPSLSRFSGVKTGGRAQALEWPRSGAVDTDGNDIATNEIPREVEEATYEAALRELTTPGSLTPDYVASSLAKREKVDVIEVEYAVEDRAPGQLPPTSPTLPVVDGLLAPLLTGACNGPWPLVV